MFVPEIDPYYQPPTEDGDSYIGEKSDVVQHLNYPGHTEEDDGLISSNRGIRAGGLPMTPNLNTPSECYMMKDSDGLTRKNSPGMPYIARHVRSVFLLRCSKVKACTSLSYLILPQNYQGSDSDFSLSNAAKKSPTPGHHQTSISPSWLSPNNSQAISHLLDPPPHHQWLEVAESDASSLPDASCDLVHLAQLSHAARVNPNLSDLARQQVGARVACLLIE